MCSHHYGAGCSQVLKSENGTKEELQAACCADPECVAIDYHPSGSGSLCASTEQSPSPPPPLDPDLASCFKDPRPNWYIPTADAGTALAYGSLDEAVRACLTSETCGAVMLDASTGMFYPRAAGEAAVESADPLNQYTLYEVSDLCIDMFMLCPEQGGKFTFVKKGIRGATPIAGVNLAVFG